jgi:hypothetical protein
VETALQDWLRAWSDRRVDDYLNFYDQRYTPLGGVYRSVWAKQRRVAIRHPGWVKVRADQISTSEMSPEEVVVGFVQTYSASTGHRETTRKSMIWRWTDGRWRIVSEQSTAIESVAVSSKADREEAATLKAQRLQEAAKLKAQREAKREAETAVGTLGTAAGAQEKPAPTPAPNPSAFEPAVRAWIKAWADRQVDANLAFYAPGFEVAAGQDQAAWAAERRESMTRPAWIKVRADQLKTSVDGDTAQARFIQVYVVAPGTVELTRKTMRWIWSNGRWQILQEQSEPMARKHAGK